MNSITLVKEIIAFSTHKIQNTEGYSNVRVSVDVDPY